MRSAALGIVQNQGPFRVGSALAVQTAAVCLATADPHVERVVVAAFSTDPATAAFYRNDVRARIQQDARGQAMTGAGTPPIATGKAAFITVAMFSGRGPTTDQSDARLAASEMELSVGVPTPGGEIGLSGRGAQIVVASSLSSRPFGGLGGGFQTSGTAVIAASVDRSLGSLAAAGVQARMLGKCC